ncbi:hypothetical protein [Cytobacillus oceanisediminis]|uniref:hypothetical protein n=1 Tax=Cytobacillus oceanisediminis TaxID=665099 RepID=UPI0024959C19|nr:hypothetical protein [Cytobacillus oceanisediminis]
MNTQNKHTTKAIGISLLITIFAFFNVDIPKPYTVIYLLFVSVASFISIYLISMIYCKSIPKVC